MKFICPFIFAVLLAAPLWAKTSYYILPMHLKNVHEDYAEKIVSLTKEYVAVEGDEVVPNKSDCDYLLQIKLIRKEKGVVVVFEKMNDSGEILWSYGHIAYSPEGFVPIVKRVVRKMNAWENEFICGFSLADYQRCLAVYFFCNIIWFSTLIFFVVFFGYIDTGLHFVSDDTI